MQETKFILSGRWERPNGHIMRDELSYIKATKQEAIDTCQRLNPYFHIHTVRVDESVTEVVKLQLLIWHREAAARVRSGKWHIKDARTPRPCIL